MSAVGLCYKQEAHLYLRPLPDYVKKLSGGVLDNRNMKAVADQVQSLTLAGTFITR